MAYNVGKPQSWASYPSDPPFVHSKDPVTQKTAQTSVTSIYQTHIAGYWRNVTVTWGKNAMNYSLGITVDSVDQNNIVYTCKIDIKPWHFWAKKGYKCLEVDGSQLEAYWDLKSAKFLGSPEPVSDYYVALVADNEVVLLLGDNKKKAYKRTKARPPLAEPVIFYKKENVFGKKSFSTRARFDQRKRDHDIVVESATTGGKDPEMWISIDGIILVHIQNLQWKFRGNQTVMVNKHPVEVFWDVHAWLFCAPGTHHGLFIFKSSCELEGNDDENDSSLSESLCDGSECSGNSRYFSVDGHAKAGVEFCLFLYAWKIE
ncbi:hypothetical protein SASPL_149955 [Salvia splendens]|uniref:Uncharacterized protein n=1 Tax=Salvia splendens TaxID=180675 RepID=A0A8X8Z1B0_SALSN|nr:uncharacterized protein LOC121781995 [Salvia splendens]KAG6388527.1 hypothetical protein SASPL_149955 [Salvia splendens]